MIQKQSRSAPVMRTVLEAVAERLVDGDESLIRIPEVCAATGVNYGSVYHHFGSREGVIDAAYEMMYVEMVERNIEAIRHTVESADNLDEFAAAMVPLLANLSGGDSQRSGRTIRLRIVAASLTRPKLHTMIARAQADLVLQLTNVVETAQSRGWLRRDVSPRVIAVVTQVVGFGRNVDDLTDEPISEDDWQSFVTLLFGSFLARG